MHILITGATGLIGSALVQKLTDRAERITVLTRNESRARSILGNHIGFTESLDSYESLNDVDAVVNLVGEPIANKRWTSKQKEEIENSRWLVTKRITELILKSEKPPSVLLNGSAIGFYGRQSEEVISESFENPYQDFGHHVCAEQERLAAPARSDQTRVCQIRTGIVLSKEGGALKKMAPAFLAGLGSPIASGKQYMSWIHIEDMVSALLHVLDTPECAGPINFTAPHPVTNADFSRSFAQALKRPFFMPPLPEFVMKLMFGEMSELLVYGQNVYPQVLLDCGYSFSYPNLNEALDDLYD